MSIECRLIATADIEPAVRLMRRSGVHFAGSKRERVLRAIATDAANGHPGVRIGLAYTDSEEPSGIIIALVERAKYWRWFGVRHPLAAASMGLHRVSRNVRRRIRRQAPVAQPQAFPEVRAMIGERLITCTQSWDDESPRIAKVMYLAVDPNLKRGGVGRTLYGWFMHDLGAAGFERSDAHVSADNKPAISLHLRFPFRFVDAHGGYFVWLYTNELGEA